MQGVQGAVQGLVQGKNGVRAPLCRVCRVLCTFPCAYTFFYHIQKPALRLSHARTFTPLHTLHTLHKPLPARLYAVQGLFYTLHTLHT